MPRLRFGRQRLHPDLALADRLLARVELVIRPEPGCATCRGWTGAVLEGDDGLHRPERCPSCGRVVPATVLVRIVGVRVALI